MFLNHYVAEIPGNLPPIYINVRDEKNDNILDFADATMHSLKLSVEKIEIFRPMLKTEKSGSNFSNLMFPKHARLMNVSYSGPMFITFTLDDGHSATTKHYRAFAGLIPIMVKSDLCNLTYLAPEEQAKYAGEDLNELGGYFIINGIEKLIRLTIQQRTNFPLALINKRFENRDIFFSEYAVAYRAQASDGTTMNNILFYTQNNHCAFRILLNRTEYIFSFWVLLKALFPQLDKEIIQEKVTTCCSNTIFIREAELLWEQYIESETEFNNIDVYEDRYLYILGSYFFDSVKARLPPSKKYSDAARYIIDNYILINTDSYIEKFEILLLMWEKLWMLKNKLISAENMDSLTYQQVIHPGLSLIHI